MVSKSRSRKWTPTIKTKDHRSNSLRHRKKSPVSAAASKTASKVVASINKSIYTCHRRLIKIFSKLARIATPKKSSIKKGYQVLTKFSTPTDDQIVAVRRSLFQEPETVVPLALPPSDKKTVFLDLDETLVHSKPASGFSPPGNYDFIVRPVIDGVRAEFYVLKRPFANEFLEFLSKNDFEIVVFTAGIQEYASLVLDKLDWKGLISHRLYRDSCKAVDGKFVKDLSALGRDLKKAVIVDDNPNSYGLQQENAIPISPFIDDIGDGELKKLMSGFFEKCNEFEDLRDAVKHYVAEAGGNSNLEKELIEDEIFEGCKTSNFATLVEI